MLPNEVRLVQFCTLVEAVISQVNKYKISDGIRDNGKTLKILETKIAEEILPVREKLQDRLRGVRAVAGAPATKRQNIGDAQQTALEPGSNGLPLASSGNLDVKATVNSSHRNSREAGEGEGKRMSGTVQTAVVAILRPCRMLGGLRDPRATSSPPLSRSTMVLNDASGGDGHVTSGVADDEYISQRRRKRLSQIVPNPRKPRVVDYMCSICNDQYQESVVENPWWAVRYQTCKKCGQSQIPRIDILAEANAIEHDPNVQALYGEGLEDSGDEQIMDEEAGEEGVYTYAEGEGADTGKPQGILRQWY